MANHSCPLLLVGPRAIGFLALWRTRRPTAAVVAEGGPGTRRFAEIASLIVALETIVGRRRPWSSASVHDLLPSVADTVAQVAEESALAFLPSFMIESLELVRAERAVAVRLTGPGPRLRRWLDNKQNVRSALAERSCPVVDSIAIEPGWI